MTFDEHKKHCAETHADAMRLPGIILDRVYNLAYKRGHTHSDSEIENEYIDLVQLADFVYLAALST